MRLTIAWTLNAYIYFLIIMVLVFPVIYYEGFKFINLVGTLIGILIFLLLCSIINKILVKNFFPYPKGDFVKELKNEFMKQRLSERIYLGIRDAIIPVIILLGLGSFVKTTIKGIMFTYLDVIIIGTPLLLILLLRVIFSVYQNITNKNNNL